MPVKEILSFPFVIPDLRQFGLGISKEKSNDGWRDDHFKRQVRHVAPSLFILLKLIRSGKMVGYIPDYLGHSEGLKKVNISGCPYTCSFSIFAIFRENLLLLS